MFDFLAMLEIARKKIALGVVEEEQVAKGGERTGQCFIGEKIKIISWNVRGLNCPNKRGMLDGCFVILDVILLFYKNIRWKRSIVLLVLAFGVFVLWIG